MRVCMNAMVMIEKRVVHVNLFVTHLNNISFNADDPLDKILAGVLGKFKDDDISAFWFCYRNNRGLQKWNLDTVNKFIDQNVVPDQKGLLHGTRGDFKRLNDKRTDKQGQKDGHKDRFNIFPKTALFFGADVFFFRFGRIVFLQV